jgi:hypothetical protein
MHVSQHWRLKAQRYALVGSQCPICGSKFFPPQPVCPDCLARRAAQEPAYILEIPAGELEMAAVIQNVQRVPVKN